MMPVRALSCLPVCLSFDRDFHYGCLIRLCSLVVGRRCTPEGYVRLQRRRLDYGDDTSPIEVDHEWIETLA